MCKVQCVRAWQKVAGRQGACEKVVNGGRRRYGMVQVCEGVGKVVWQARRW